MKSLSSRLTYANVVSTLCLLLLVGGGAAYAASRLGKNTVGSKQLKKNAVTGAKVKNQSLTGKDVNLKPEAWHIVGAPGESPFTAPWTDLPEHAPVAFYKDHEGVVHLKGTAFSPTGIGGDIFRLPPGYRPAQTSAFPVVCEPCSKESALGFLEVQGSGPGNSVPGNVHTGAGLAYLSGITFRAES